MLKSVIFIFFILVLSLTIYEFAQNKRGSSLLYGGIALEGSPITSSKIEQTSKDFPWPPQIIVFYLQWPSQKASINFPKESLDAIWNRGAIPCLTWEPMSIENGKEHFILFESLLAGEYDSYLTAFAKAATQWNKPFMIRFAHEMNLNRYHWGTTEDHYNSQSPQLYSKAFQYVVRLFRINGAFNVLWAFNPNAESIPSPKEEEGSWNEIHSYYPGDEYVDLLGIDGYNWGSSKAKEWGSTWRSFKEIFSDAYHEVKQLSSKKPLIIFETASVSEEGFNQEEWLNQAIKTCQDWKVNGLIWFQVYKEADWRLPNQMQSSPEFSTQPEPQEWVKQLVQGRNTY